MIISIASGKGGTGKTSVAVALALSLEKPAQLLDCDVEAPNAHIFMKTRWEKKETVYLQIPKADEEKCTYCQACSQLCQFKAILVLGETILTFPEMCHACGGCFLVCAPKALIPDRKELGEVEEGWAGPVHFVHGRLRVGEPLSPPLIKEVKKRIDRKQVVILDSPPGTSCPVIQTVKGSDFTILVTEPTPFGLYDLKLAVEALGTLGIPCGVILNRADIGDNQVQTYLESEGIPLLMKIPFDRKIAEGYAQGQSLVEIHPELREKFQKLFHEILKGYIKNYLETH
ncbi:MAG: ATP-binding protein [Deltaproteobacteria bacterium]|nr:ATP-binding protein [Deltaproteobacteria bacterium]